MIHKTRGSALIFILIAIALLGGLTVMLSRTSTSTEETGASERGSIEGSRLMAYSNSLKQAVDAMMLRGCSETELNFNHTSLTGYANPNAPSNKSCDIFDVAGGGITLKYFPDATIPPTVVGGYTVFGVGTASTELLYLYRGVSREACKSINNSLAIPNNGTEGPPSDPLSNGVKFVGSYTSAGGTANETISTTEFRYKKAGCRLQSGSGTSSIFEYYHVLIAR